MFIKLAIYVKKVLFYNCFFIVVKIQLDIKKAIKINKT